MKGGVIIKTLELTSDVVFKAFMLSKNNLNYKTRLLHLITGIPESKLRKSTYTSEELKINHKSDKVYKTDIIIKVTGHIISLEMNKNKYDSLFIKNKTYASKMESEELEQGKSYLNIKRIITININNFHAFKGDKVLYKFMMREIDTGEIEDDLFVSYHIDLPRLRKMQYNNSNELESLLQIFVRDNLGELRGGKYMDEAIDEVERISSDERIIGLYDKEKVERKLLNSIKEEIRIKSRAKGLAEGRAEGRAEGLTEGHKQGFVEGENHKQKEIIASMRESGFNDEIIAKILNISLEDLKNNY